MVKNPSASAGDIRGTGWIPGLGRFPRRRAWQPTPVFLPGESHGQRSLAGYSPWGHKGSDMTERLTRTQEGERSRNPWGQGFRWGQHKHQARLTAPCPHRQLGHFPISGQKVARLLGDEETAFSNYPAAGRGWGPTELGAAGGRAGGLDQRGLGAGSLRL